MTKIRPRRTPKGEDLKVTIANQDKQIRLLTDRVIDLCAARDRAQTLSDENYENGKAWKRQCSEVERERDALRKDVENLKGINNYNNGYIARVKEMDGMPPFPAGITGA